LDAQALEILKKEKILVIQTAFLGDAVLTLPSIQRLKEKYPKSHMVIMCIPSTKDLFECSPSIDEFIVYDKRGEQKSLLTFFNILKSIRQQRFLRVYSFHRSFRSSLISFFSKAKFTTGFDKSSFSLLYKKRIKYNADHHEVARNLELIGEDTQNEKWRILPIIKLFSETEQKIKNIVKEINAKNIAAIAPGSFWETKIYPQEYFFEIIKFLIEQNFFIVLVGGKDDESLCKEFEDKYPLSSRSLAGKLNVAESIYLLRECKLLITNDSAPTHLGMAANIPTLTIFCSTVPSFGFYPYNKKSEYLSFDYLDCKPCGIHGHRLCPIKTFDCGNKLLPSKVFTKIRLMLAS
jgi:heptosyltransferase II